MSATVMVTADALTAVDLLSVGLSSWSIELTPSNKEAFAVYATMLVDWNASRFNLTRLVTPEQIALNHFLDSLVLTQILNVPYRATLIDIGTGPGFPGLAFKIFRPDIRLILIESTAKKLSFCSAVASELAIDQVEFVHGRAEEAAVIRRFGQSGNIVTARAVAPLKTLLDWTAPYATPAGAIVAWKGIRVHEEIAEAKKVSEKYGLTTEVVKIALGIPDSQRIDHYYVVCRRPGQPFLKK